MPARIVLVHPASPTLPSGDPVQFSATAVYNNGDTVDATDQATWATSDPQVATVSAGLVTPLKAGAATISAAFDGQTGESLVTVTVALLSLAVSPNNLKLQAGVAQQLTAIGSYSDGSEMDLTGAVSWRSTKAGVASVTSSGLVTAVAPGIAAIVVEPPGVLVRSNTVIAGAAVEVVPTTLSPCERLALAQKQLDQILAGKSVRVIETPQLGRVEFQSASADQLQRMIVALKGECADYLGVAKPMARGPISIEVDP